MNRYPKLLAGAVSAIAVTLPLTIAGVAWGQDQTFRQIVVEPQDKEKAAEKDKGGAKSETASTAAGEAEKEAAPEKKAAAVSDDAKQATAPAQTEKVEPKKESAPAAKTAAAPDKKAPDSADAPEAAPVKLSTEDIALTLQTELKRVGCYYGSLDGIWGPQSRSALDAFGHYGKIELNDFNPSEAWIEHVRGKTKTVCTGNYGYAHPYGGTERRPGYERGPGYDRPPPGGYRRGGYDRY